MRQALKGINAEVRELAPALNAADVTGAVTVRVAGGGRVDATVRRAGGRTYLFAVNMKRQGADATFDTRGLPAGQARVLFEDRTLPVRDGAFTDAFAPYGVHRYELLP